MKSVVFDSFAVIAWLYDEPASDHVGGLLRAVDGGTMSGGICVVNLGEVYYSVARRDGLARADATLSDLQDAEWTVYPAHDGLVYAAARFKAHHRISYADAFALACAQEQQAELVTGDPELLAADHGVPILWPGHGPA